MTRHWTLVCPSCNKERTVQSNSPPANRLCRFCNGKAAAKRPKHQLATATTHHPQNGLRQAPCVDGTQAHWWWIPQGQGSERCRNGCGAQFAQERWGTGAPSAFGGELLLEATYYTFEAVGVNTW